MLLHQRRREKSESALTRAQQPMLTHSRNLRLWILGKVALPGADWQASGSLWNSVAVGSSDSPSITGVEDTDSSVSSEPSEGKKKQNQKPITVHCFRALHTESSLQGRRLLVPVTQQQSVILESQPGRTTQPRRGQEDMWTARAAFCSFLCPLPFPSLSTHSFSLC